MMQSGMNGDAGTPAAHGGQAKSSHPASDGATSPVDNGSPSCALKRTLSSHIAGHGHAVLYGALGFVVAALILIIGFWQTVLLSAFVALGVFIGRYHDGDHKVRAQVMRLIGRFN